MKDLFYISKSGEVRWNKFPEEPNHLDYKYQNELKEWMWKSSLHMMNYYDDFGTYEQVIQSAKDSSILCADKDQALNIISPSLPSEILPLDSLHPFPSEQYEVEVKWLVDNGVQKKETECRSSGYGGKGLTYQVAVITPRKKEETTEEKTTVLVYLEALADKNGYSAALLNASDDIVALTFELEQAELKMEKLQAFKDYVHDRLDKMGIPSDPEPESNLAHGCRIEGRLNALTSQFQSEPVLNEGKGEDFKSGYNKAIDDVLMLMCINPYPCRSG